MASLSISSVYSSWIKTRAYRPSRIGNTKPPCKVGKVTVEFPGASIAHISSDKTLVLCQEELCRRTYKESRLYAYEARVSLGYGNCIEGVPTLHYVVEVPVALSRAPRYASLGACPRKKSLKNNVLELRRGDLKISPFPETRVLTGDQNFLIFSKNT